MGKWIKKTSSTPLTSESKVINDFNTSADPTINTFSINVIRNALVAAENTVKTYVNTNFTKKNYAEFANPENFITLRAGDTLNRVSFVKNMNVIYFSAIITLNSDVAASEAFFTINDTVNTYGKVAAAYAFDAIGTAGGNARSFTYDPTNKTFINTGSTVSSGSVIRLSASWAVEE